MSQPRPPPTSVPGPGVPRRAVQPVRTLILTRLRSIPEWEHRYFRICEAAAWIFAARLLLLYRENLFVIGGFLLFAAFESVRLYIEWAQVRRQEKELADAERTARIEEARLRAETARANRAP